MKADLIHAIDNRVLLSTAPLKLTDEYRDFPATANRLIKIRGKLLHGEMLTKNDIITLRNENFYI